ncbi:MAG: hypothetical protein GY774_10575 [Planctomycetes bacterium]|nr:hypothetical protein [Planctomycetota bacterium]
MRWTILTAWIALEIACQDALEDDSISRSFQKNLNKAIASKNLPELDWSQGLWQKVTQVQNLRKGVVHRFASEEVVFPEIELAESSIEIIRDAIKDIYKHCDKNVPEWVEDDHDEGWTTGVSRLHATGTSSPYYKKEGAIKIAYVYKGNEYMYDYLAPNTDVNQPLENIFKGVGKPITAVRLYRDETLLVEYLYEESKVRGA